MPRIHQLPPLVVSKIAAGEVIERPASVVKELLENSVDAGSTRIDIEVEQGGVELLRVSDDGCGIVAEDLALAFSSHATSKLRNADDLFQIGTLGFRGEALASIGGVAQVALQSRPADEESGAEITCHGGELSPVRPWNGSPGTRIEVRHLFYNTPVRRKFLKTIGTELGHVSETFTRLALAHPNLHLTLRHNAKRVYEVPGSATLLDRLGLFFGQEVRDQLYEINAEAGPVKLTGFIADPACERGTAKMQYLFLNGRYIRDRSLGHALQEGYRGLLMTGRYAAAFLFIQMPPDLVDVNVHPTKSEVRFRDSSSMYHLVLSSVRDRLRKENLTPKLQVPHAAFQTANETPWTLTPPAAPSGELPFAPGKPLPPAPVFALPPEAQPAREQLPPAELTDLEDEEETPLPPVVSSETPVPAKPKVIQLYDSYIVMETPAGMLVIDQHALHERIMFEQIKRRIRDGVLEVQRLLIPEPIDLSAEQATRVLEQRDGLLELGLGVEDFGGGTVLLTSYPALLGQRSPLRIFKAVVDHVVSKERAPTREQMLNDILALMACHSAVRAGDRLSEDEMNALLAQRDLANDSHHCPHGRPTTLLFSKQDLDRQFRRT